jgi:hypothetical protein
MYHALLELRAAADARRMERWDKARREDRHAERAALLRIMRHGIA